VFEWAAGALGTSVNLSIFTGADGGRSMKTKSGTSIPPMRIVVKERRLMHIGPTKQWLISTKVEKSSLNRHIAGRPVETEWWKYRKGPGREERTPLEQISNNTFRLSQVSHEPWKNKKPS
jgi:hypothetical protein